MSTWDDKPNDYDHAIEQIARLKAALRWTAEQRWNENADLDDICAKAESVLRGLEK